LRVRVIDVLEWLDAGETPEQILATYPYLEREDISAALLFTAGRLDHASPGRDLLLGGSHLEASTKKQVDHGITLWAVLVTLGISLGNLYFSYRKDERDTSSQLFSCAANIKTVLQKSVWGSLPGDPRFVAALNDVEKELRSHLHLLSEEERERAIEAFETVSLLVEQPTRDGASKADFVVATERLCGIFSGEPVSEEPSRYQR